MYVMSTDIISSKVLSQTTFFFMLTCIFPERPKYNNENTDVITTSSHSNCLVAEDSCYFCRFSSVSNELLTCKCYGVL
jgi:hypothetical protein